MWDLLAHEKGKIVGGLTRGPLLGVDGYLVPSEFINIVEGKDAQAKLDEHLKVRVVARPCVACW